MFARCYIQAQEEYEEYEEYEERLAMKSILVAKSRKSKQSASMQGMRHSGDGLTTWNSSKPLRLPSSHSALQTIISRALFPARRHHSSRSRSFEGFHMRLERHFSTHYFSLVQYTASHADLYEPSGYSLLAEQSRQIDFLKISILSVEKICYPCRA
jgi:hypothetical protein